MYKVLIAMSTLVLALPVLAGDFNSGSDGSDGPLNCATLGLGNDCANTCTAENPCAVEIDLRLATTASWDTPSPDPGRGVYDADEWAVVYKYTTINIPAFVTVTFANHPKGAPLMWLATGDVTIAGTVRLDGADGSVAEGSSYAVPGPGGFSGGIGILGTSAGFGPGGGNVNFGGGGGGGYGTAGSAAGGGVTYGTVSIVPLIGGSGGSAQPPGGVQAGGAGGGAILIASSMNISLDSTAGIFAKGGEAATSSAGSGSGGGIRLIADAVTGSGILRAVGGGPLGNDGGFGRIRVEGTDIQMADGGIPPFTTDIEPGPVFPDPAAPSLRVTAINGKPVPVDPLATVVSPDVAFTAEGVVPIEIEALNIEDIGVDLIVTVRIVQALGGLSFVVPSTPLEDVVPGDGILTATADFNFSVHPPGQWEVQVSVQLP